MGFTTRNALSARLASYSCYQIIDVVTIFEGSLTTSAVYPREVVKLILERDAAAVIFVHNHPSGNLSPNRDDHLINGGNDYFFFADHSLL